ncbi:hypothetical protein DFH94DRAFT_18750 [Russula ochroleuca]|jgi:hypothetical protein|uniref:Uncharacterized protein n=1 Tax=Russula ochroleuca TaxID=152965 RepID=A0A9P5TES9_9AGAM|nr:hypothetical protein DFH94DRAFT_18692 [Russula ochroleuca]KAF8487225.1 hypothetical protein DFH94DRAFT_18750 [Russula ochroleuca]
MSAQGADIDGGCRRGGADAGDGDGDAGARDVDTERRGRSSGEGGEALTWHAGSDVVNHRGRGVAQGDGAQMQMGKQGRSGGHRIQGGGETNPSAHVWGKGGGSFGGMKEKGTPTRSRLRRGWGLGHKKPLEQGGATRDFSRDIIWIVGILKSALDRVGVRDIPTRNYHRAEHSGAKWPIDLPQAYGHRSE